MKTYKVTISRTYYIKAKDEDSAESKADEIFSEDCDDFDFDTEEVKPKRKKPRELR